MNGVKRLVSPVLLLALALGCAPREIQGPLQCRERCRENLSVAVAAFRDERPEEEIGTPPARPYPVAADPARDMSAEMARDLVERLRKAEVFLAVTAVEASGSPPSAALLARLAARGYDAVLTGNVPRCLGSTCVTGGDLTGYFVLKFVGIMFNALLPLPLGFYHNEGVVSVTDLQLTDTRTGEVFWSGSFKRNVVHYTGDPSPGPAIHDAMHELTRAIAEDLQRRLLSGRQAPPPELPREGGKYYEP